MAEKLEDLVKKNTQYKVLISHDSEDKRFVIIMGDRTRQNYIRAFSGGKEYIISLPFDLCGYHREIKHKLEEEIGKRVVVKGGGEIEYIDNVIGFCGASGDYGEANHEEVAEILREVLAFQGRLG